jgi:hypothetical protein
MSRVFGESGVIPGGPSERGATLDLDANSTQISSPRMRARMHEDHKESGEGALGAMGHPGVHEFSSMRLSSPMAI